MAIICSKICLPLNNCSKVQHCQGKETIIFSEIGDRTQVLVDSEHLRDRFNRHGNVSTTVKKEKSNYKDYPSFRFYSIFL
jgi:hypothetical protein